MGTFGGHITPGLFLITLSVHWSISIYSRYFKSLKGKPYKTFQCTRAYPLFCFPHLNIEGYFIILSTILAIILQIAKGVQGEFPYIRVNCLQHIAMYSFFTISGVFDVLIAKGYRIPRNSDYAMFILAVTVTGLVFGHHGHMELHWAMHKFIVYITIAGVAILGLEMTHKENVLCAIVRTFLNLTLGTWFIQTAFVMYNPFPNHHVWDPTNQQDMMMIMVLFTLHVGFALFYVIVVGFIMYFIQGKDINDCNNEMYQKLIKNEEDSSVKVEL